MKRIGAFFLAFLLLCACGAPGAQGSALEQANRHLDTPFSLAMPAEEAEKHATQYRYGGGFGGFTLENQDARYMLSGYPDVLDAYHVTEIRLLSTKYHIFGVTHCKTRWRRFSLTALPRMRAVLRIRALS